LHQVDMLFDLVSFPHHRSFHLSLLYLLYDFKIIFSFLALGKQIGPACGSNDLVRLNNTFVRTKNK
jgi:hypothetical protein